MRFDLKASFTFSSDISSITKEIESFISSYGKDLLKKDKSAKIEGVKIQKNLLSLDIISEGIFRPHNALLQMKNAVSKEFGKKHHLGVREIKIENYAIEFELEKKPLKKIIIPFADVKFNGKQATVLLKNVDEEFLQRNYIDRMITLVREKVENQYYEGKEEFWKLIWESGEKKPVWSRDPTEEMANLGWLKQGPSKGKWFFRPQATAIMKTMLQCRSVLKIPKGMLALSSKKGRKVTAIMYKTSLNIVKFNQ